MASHSIVDPLFGNMKEKTEHSTMGIALSRLKEIAGSGYLNTKQKRAVLHQLQAAEARFKDSKLNLAIIGEFSCGKSTFINALFQREILSTNMQPTTAVPTYITWNNRHIDDPYGQYEVTVYDRKGGVCSLVKDNGREAFESLTGIQLPKEPERLIDAVTTDNRLASVVSKVTIKAPLNNQYKGICLIDTPGVNPGTEGTAEHVRITQKVLRDAADAAIIMFPADQVYTASFGRFLEENASHLLKHSIFVITKCDIIQSEGELKDLCDFVSHHLSKIGVMAPEVHCISASYALDAYLNGGKASNDERMWQKRFEATIKAIFKELASRRNSIVHENVTAIADQITRLLTDILSTKRAALDKTREDLTNFSPEKMKAECNKLLKECEVKMLAKKDAQESSVFDVIGSAIESKKKFAFNSIDNCSTTNDVSVYLNRFNSHAMSTVNDAISSRISSFKMSLSSILSNYKQKLDECYKQYHLNISTTQVHTLQLGDAGKIDTDELKTSVSGFLTVSRLLEDAGKVFEDIFDSDSLAEGVVKTAAGLIALPFVVAGTIFNTFRPLDSIKSDAKDRVRSALESNRDAACRILNDSISKVYDRYLNAAQQMPKKIVERFSAEFSQAQSLYNHQLQSTNHQIAQLNSQLEQLHMIASKISNT